MIAAPLTPEQKRQKQLEEERQKAEQVAAEEQRKKDHFILTRYNSEADIEASRKRSVNEIEQQIDKERTALAMAQQKLTSAQADADYQKKQNRPVADLQQKIDAADHIVQQQKKVIETRQTDIVQLNIRYDQTLKRFREITGSASSAEK